jgi:hypothetical protein
VTNTDYKDWLTARDAVQAKGSIMDFVIFMVENPSPLQKRTAFSDEPPTGDQVLHAALYQAALTFKGTKVRIDATDEPLASSRWIWKVEGTLRGIGSLCAEGNGVRDTDLIVVENEHGHFSTVRISHVVSMENL